AAAAPPVPVAGDVLDGDEIGGIGSLLDGRGGSLLDDAGNDGVAGRLEQREQHAGAHRGGQGVFDPGVDVHNPTGGKVDGTPLDVHLHLPGEGLEHDRALGDVVGEHG